VDAQKKTQRAAEQDPVARQQWCEDVAPLPVEDFVFVDETSTNTAMARRYARSPIGERAYGNVPRNYGHSTTLVASLTLDGLGPAMTIEGAIDTLSFIEYLRQLLCPTLRAGQVVVMDNLSAHKSETVRELIEAAQCRLLFLPTYSPDYSPIELAYSKIKEILRAAAARSKEDLIEAIAQALDKVTSKDAVGWFAHCGYSLAR
jgi:transposase